MQRLVSCLALLLVLIPAGASAAEPVRIAALYNLTGGMASIDAPALDGAKLAARHVNDAGGLLGGRPIELVAIDTKTDVKAAAAGAEKALTQGVVAGIGYGDTNFVMAAAPLFQAKGIPFVTSGATHPMLPTWIGDCLFMTAFGDDDQAYAIADYALDTLKTANIAVLTDTAMDFTKALAAFFTERATKRGGKIVLEDAFAGGDTDFSAQVNRLQAANPRPDAVFVAAVPAEAGLIVKQIRAAGLSLPILSGDGFDTELVTSIPGPELAENVFFATHTFRGDARPEVAAFVAAYREFYGRDPESAFAALGYDAVNLLSDAIRRAGSTDPAALRKALIATRGFKAVTGTISYGRLSGVPIKPVSIIGVHHGFSAVESVWTPEN